MSTNKFDLLSDKKFNETAEVRLSKINEAGSLESLPKEFPVNTLAKRLHPDRQYMTIESIVTLAPDTKKIRFVPDPSRGTTECAYFLAGQYINVFAEVNGVKTNRAYSISSSPKNSVEGFYEITVKQTKDGLVSTYILNEWKEGDQVEISAPMGDFYYSSIRDPKYIVAVAGGSGITPFLSMANAIYDGDLDFDLTVLFGSRTEDSILYKNEFDELTKKSDKIHVVHILSDEEKEGYEHGFINEEIIRKYAPEKEEYSVFMCGSQGMYLFLEGVTAGMGLPKKNVRRELFGEVHGTSLFKDYPGCKLDEVKLTVHIQDCIQTVTGSPDSTVVQILEQNGIIPPTRCRSGECGFCHSLCVSGEYYTPAQIDGRRIADKEFGYIHPCATFPLTDMEIIVPSEK